jgi:hypothetical protein
MFKVGHQSTYVTEGQRLVEQRARDLASISHLAEQRRAQRARDLRIHRLGR